MNGTELPGELYLWQCETCQRVMDVGADWPGGRTHLQPGEGHFPRVVWCTGKVRRVTYRLVTRSDYQLRA